MTWDFSTEPEFEAKLEWMRGFMRDEVYPIEVLQADEAGFMRAIRPLQQEVKQRKLWATHLPPELGGQGYGQVKLGLMHEIEGASMWGPIVFGNQAPDSGNSEVLAHFGNEAQKKRWLHPLLDGKMRSGFSMTEPNTGNRCSNAEDANWAAPFLFGRWAWDGYLFGAPLSGPGVSLIDATYDYGFGRLAGKLPPGTFGGYPTQYYSTAYNAGYGEWGLASQRHRDQGILSYQFMIANGQSGPYSWWESQQFPNPGSPWTGTHPEAGNGSSPHAWGMANANMVLLDSLAAQRADGDLVVGRGVPGSWLSGGQPIQLANMPTTDGHHVGLTIRGHGSSVTLTLTGQPSGPVLFQLPAFVSNIASASAGTVDEQTGTVTLAPTVHSVTVQLKQAAG